MTSLRSEHTSSSAGAGSSAGRSVRWWLLVAALGVAAVLGLAPAGCGPAADGPSDAPASQATVASNGAAENSAERTDDATPRDSLVAVPPDLEEAGAPPAAEVGPTAAAAEPTGGAGEAPATPDLAPAEGGAADDGRGGAAGDAEDATLAGCLPTEPDSLGPFYEPDAPERTQVGEGYVLTGRVWAATTCTPIAGAKIEAWLAGPDGAYGDAYRATLYSDEEGAYRFESHPPVGYGGRPPHIHLRVTADGYEELVTQYYPEPDETEGVFLIVLSPAEGGGGQP